MTRALNGLTRHSVAAVLLASTPLLAHAGAGLIDRTVDNTNTLNAGAQIVNGRYVTPNDSRQTAIPWVTPIFAGANECVRIQFTNQANDLEAVLVATDGRAWRDDDGGGSLLPLLKVQTTTAGWYTLAVANFAGAAGNGDFTFSYGRFNSSSANCSGATAPAISAEQARGEK
ncbi:MAG: hypothetical protein ACT4QA_23285 [Panacagrimonas sp.]